jgi:hypothetical protein
MARILTNKPPFNHLTAVQVREAISMGTCIPGMSEDLKEAILAADWEEGPEDRSRKDWEVNLRPRFGEYTVRVFEFGSITIYGTNMIKFELRKF